MKRTFYSRFFAIALLLFPVLVFGQRTITGTVTDNETGETLIGVNILVVGTSSGGTTDFDGNYSVTVPDGATTLLFTYTGFGNEEVTLGDSDVVDVIMSSGVDFEEVVVIGYGSIKKEDRTGSVNVVDSKDFNGGAIATPEQLLVGKVSGVQITTDNGAPGSGVSIRIRGNSSISGGNEPLYVIDGFPLENSDNPGSRNPLSFINPADIENFTILKDASATAIYGSRGANGVVLITTKKGQAGAAPRVEYNGYLSVNTVNTSLDNFNGDQFRNLVTFAAPDRIGDLGENNTNWLDEMTETAIGHSHALSVAGGGQNSAYRASFQYQDFGGVVKPADNENLTFGLNFNQKLFDDRLSLTLDYKGGFTRNQFDPDLVGSAWALDPTQPVLDPDNDVFDGFFEYSENLAPRNPVSAAEQLDRSGRSYRNLANFEIDYAFLDQIPGLSLRLNLGFDLNNGDFMGFEPTTYTNTAAGAARNGFLIIENFTRESKLLDAFISYDRVLGEKHSINATAGYSYQDFQREFPKIEASGFENDNLLFDNVALADQTVATRPRGQNRLISFVGRAIYTYDNKYILSASIRRDGSSRFGPDNQWGLYPAVSASWKIMEEDFAQGGLSNIFSTLSLRAGFGIVGNQDGIGEDLYRPIYTFSDQMSSYQFGDEFVLTARPDGYDRSIGWEETQSINIGLDFGFANGRIQGSIEYFNELTRDLLFDTPVAAGTNLTDRITTNIGTILNSGLELNLDGALVNTNNFRWNVNANASYLVNEVSKINTDAETGILTGGIEGGVGNNAQIIQVDQPSFAFYLYEHLLDAQGNPLVDGVDHNEDGDVNLADIYADTNGDGVVDDLDRRAIGQPAPDLLFGFTSQMSYKGLDFGFTIRGSIGNEIYNNNASSRGFYNFLDINPVYLNNLHTSVLLTNFNEPQYFSDYYLEDGSFARIENITLGYTIPSLDKMTARVYATATNVYTFTNYSGLDPEVEGGIDQSPFPRTLGFVFGISLGL
ncbi:MAG: TonB-dependent receptor [Bacteroidota bacterium]